MPQEPMTIEDFRRAQKMPRVRGAHRVKVDGYSFQSKKEANRYRELRLMEKAGQITSLALQVPYPIEVNGMHVTTYMADFQYWDVKLGRQITEDTKGFVTDIYRLKKKLVRAVYGVEIVET